MQMHHIKAQIQQRYKIIKQRRKKEEPVAKTFMTEPYTARLVLLLHLLARHRKVPSFLSALQSNKPQTSEKKKKDRTFSSQFDQNHAKRRDHLVTTNPILAIIDSASHMSDSGISLLLGRRKSRIKRRSRWGFRLSSLIGHCRFLYQVSGVGRDWRDGHGWDHELLTAWRESVSRASGASPLSVWRQVVRFWSFVLLSERERDR